MRSRGVTIAVVLGLVFPAGADAAATWLAPSTISSAGQDAQNHSVAVDPVGNATVVRFGFDGANWRVQASRRPAGGAWEAPVTLSAAGADAGGLQVEADRLGNLVALWHRSDGTVSRLQAASRPAGGLWEPAVTLTDGSESALSERAVFGPDGAITVVIERNNGVAWRVQAVTRSPGGGWGRRSR